MIVRAAVVALAIVACAGNGVGGSGSAPAWNSTGAGWPRRVVGKEDCLDGWSDRRCRPWRRSDDPQFGEMHLLVGDDNSGCVVDAATAVMAVYGEEFTCRWRSGRLNDMGR